MNFDKIYEATQDLEAPLQSVEDGLPVRERRSLVFDKVLIEAHLQEMAELYPTKVVDLIWGHLQFSNQNFKTEQERDAFLNKLNLPEFINRCFEKAVDVGSFITFMEPPQESAWLTKTKSLLQNKATNETAYNKMLYEHIVNTMIIKGNLLENAIVAAKAYQQKRQQEEIQKALKS